MRSLLKAALAVALAVGLFFLARSGTGHRPAPGRDSAGSKARALPAGEAATNLAALADGFYLGKGDERVYINYASPDPVLRSFMQSVMDGNLDPNAKGRAIFMKICAACHQKDGEGKEGVAPPLAGSEWVLSGGGARLSRIVLNGLNGPIQVRGAEWNLPMPPWRAILDDDQVAVVLTYTRTELSGKHAGPVAAGVVAAARQVDRPKPETSAELLQISDP